MGENICKWSNPQEINPPNIQTGHAAQYQKNKQKMLNITNYLRNANKTTRKYYYLTMARMAPVKKSTNNKMLERVSREGKLPTLLVEM